MAEALLVFCAFAVPGVIALAGVVAVVKSVHALVDLAFPS